MTLKKRNIIIVEGPQGVGKSTLANFLRDNLPSTNLYRLSGINDKTKTGKEKNEIMYLELIDYMKKLEKTELNMVFDRFFFSEQVYSKLGYKEYLFDDVYEKLLNIFYELNYNVYFVVLYLKNEKLYEKRLKRVHHNYKEFSLKSSVDQQKTYLELADYIDKSKVKVIKVAMDDYKEGYNKIIKDIPLLKESNIKYETI